MVKDNVTKLPCYRINTTCIWIRAGRGTGVKGSSLTGMAGQPGEIFIFVNVTIMLFVS